MRTPEEMLDLIRKAAWEDEHVRAVTLGGSRANRDCPADEYQDRENMWKAAFETLHLFGDAARFVAGKMDFVYNESEEKGIADYMELVRGGLKM